MNLTRRPIYQKGKKSRKVKSQEEREDAEFRAWIRRQPSCISGAFTQFHNGICKNIAAHVLRVSRGSGKAIKPLFSAVPLTQDEHLLQHQHGEEYFKPKWWWEQKADYYLAYWRKERAMP